MILIDAEALEEHGWIMHRTVAVDPQTMEWQTKKPTDFPSIDAASMKHGEWITKGQDIYCSACGGESAYTWHGSSKFSAYCPNCGAEMRVGTEMTNADRIRAMTDAELAEWINKHDCHTNLYGYDPKEAVLVWLKSGERKDYDEHVGVYWAEGKIMEGVGEAKTDEERKEDV